MKRVLKIIGLVLLTFFLAFAWFAMRPETYLPHQKITIAAPFSVANPPIWIAPMGETIEHPDAPLGHPGIDFAWQQGAQSEILSSADGRVQFIKLGTSHEGLYDVEVKHGYFYVTRYKELARVNPDLKKGSRVKKGDLIGTAGTIANGFHWEFASISMVRDRFCPINYFDPESRTLVQKIWDQIPSDNHFKKDFPEICSGGYKGREE